MSALSTVALAFDDVGLAVPVQEALEAAGHRVIWRADLTPAAVRTSGLHFDAVVIDATGALDQAAEDWRDLDPPPALLAVGVAEAEAAAAAAAVPFADSTQPPPVIAAALQRALALRWVGRLSPAFARGALGVRSSGEPLRDAAAVIAGARRMPFELAREALRGHAGQYVIATAMVAELREQRALEIPEVELTKRLDGARTVRTVAAGGAMEATAALRALWALCSVGAAALSDEPPDPSSPVCRAVAEARRHVRARRARVARTTIYDLLEVDRVAGPADRERAVRALAIRFSPERLGALDLGELAAQVAPMWEQLQKAYAVFADPNLLALYDNKIKSQPPPGALWWQGPFDSQRAEQHFARGQKALIDGEAFKAVSEFAAAARLHPDHPDYEASLAWARFRADVARGKDKLEVARRERASAEEVTYGRRPWPRALIALALLCAAAEDADAARWHLREALEVDPSSPTARQLLARLAR
jgi:hypothetical protein